MPAMLTPFTTALISSRKYGEKSQRVGRVVGDTRDQSCDQDLASHHASVQFIHLALPMSQTGARDMDDIQPRFNRFELGWQIVRGAPSIVARWLARRRCTESRRTPNVRRYLDRRGGRE
jgi:hypothetical protein